MERIRKERRQNVCAETVEKLRFSDNLCSDYAEHESSESSHSETFSLQKYKNRGTRPRFLCNHEVIAISRALPRGCKGSLIGRPMTLRLKFFDSLLVLYPKMRYTCYIYEF